MQTTRFPIEYDDAYEYHGSTTIEVTRRQQGRKSARVEVSATPLCTA